MNSEIELKRICDLNNGEFKGKTFKSGSGVGSFVHISNYKLNIFYRNFNLNIKYDFGNSDTAEFIIEAIDNLKYPEFEIDTISNFSKVVLFRKHSWNIKSSDNLLKEKIQFLMTRFKLDKLIENSAFELNTLGKLKKENYSIRTVFSLSYEGNIESAELIINFHKSLIDLMLSYRNLCYNSRG